MNPSYKENGTTISVDNALRTLSDNGFVVNKISSSGSTLVSKLALEIRTRSPIFLKGNEEGKSVGHAWVCDGYKCNKVQYAAYMIESLHEDYIFYSGMTDIVSQYFHMNIGWGKDTNMWYYLEDVNPGGSAFNSSRAYYSIRPNK